MITRRKSCIYWILYLSFFFSIQLVTITSQTCTLYQSKTYPSLAQANAIPEGTLVYKIANFTSLFQPLLDATPLLLSGLSSSTCRTAVARYVSALVLPTCTLNPITSNPICISTCQDLISSCTILQDMHLVKTILFYQTGFKIDCDQSMYAPPPTCTSYTSTSIQPTYARCLPYSGTVCQSVIQAPTVYIPAGSCISQMDDQLSALPALLQVLSPTCGKTLAKLLCHTMFMPCDDQSAGTALQTLNGLASFNPIPLPRFPVQTLCTNMTIDCPNLNIDNMYIRIQKGDTIYAQLDLSKDRNKLDSILGGGAPNRFPDCNARTAPNGQPGYPLAPTIFMNRKFGDTTIIIRTQPNVPPSIDINPPVAKCTPFNNDEIIRYTPMNNADGTRRRDSPRSYCRGVIPDGMPIYTPPGMTLTDLNEKVRSTAWLFGLAPRDGDCANAFIQYVCWQVFLPCVTDALTIPFTVVLPNAGTTPIDVNITQPTVFPRFPCQDLCTNFATRCAPFITDNSLLTPNCTKRILGPSNLPPAPRKVLSCTSAQPIVEGQLDFPPVGVPTFFALLLVNSTAYGSTVQLGTMTYPIADMKYVIQTSCFGGMISTSDVAPMLDLPPTDMATVDWYCQAPLVDAFKPDRYGRVADASLNRINNGACSVPCPVPFYTDSQMSSIENMYVAISLLSLFITTWMLLTFLIFPEKRQKKNVKYFIFNAWAVSITLLISWWHGFNRVVCANAGRIADGFTKDSQVCTLQGFMLHFFALSLSLWWAVQAVDVLQQVCIRRKLTDRQRVIQRRIYHIICWGLPLLYAIIGVSTGSYGAWNQSKFCFLWRYEWPLFYSIISLCIVTGTSAMLVIVVIIVRSARASQKSTLFAQLVVLLRPILFIICFLVDYSLIWAFFVYKYQIEAPARASLTEWLQCKAITEPMNRYILGNLSYNCPVQPATVPSFSFYVMIHFAVASEGFFVFLIYGTERRIFELWAILLGCKEDDGGLSGDRAGSSMKSQTKTKSKTLERMTSTNGTQRHNDWNNVNPASTTSPNQSPQQAIRALEKKKKFSLSGLHTGATTDVGTGITELVPPSTNHIKATRRSLSAGRGYMAMSPSGSQNDMDESDEIVATSSIILEDEDVPSASPRPVPKISLIQTSQRQPSPPSPHLSHTPIYQHPHTPRDSISSTEDYTVSPLRTYTMSRDQPPSPKQQSVRMGSAPPIPPPQRPPNGSPTIASRTLSYAPPGTGVGVGTRPPPSFAPPTPPIPNTSPSPRPSFNRPAQPPPPGRPLNPPRPSQISIPGQQSSNTPPSPSNPYLQRATPPPPPSHLPPSAPRPFSNSTAPPLPRSAPPNRFSRPDEA